MNEEVRKPTEHTLCFMSDTPLTPAVYAQYTGVEPDVSVIMPVYQAAGFVEQAVASVLGQANVNFELVVIDDGSTDDSLDRLRSIRDLRLTLLGFKSNRGQAEARNTAVQMASAPLICFFDADDIMLGGSLSAHLLFFQKIQNAAWAYGVMAQVDEQGHPLNLNLMGQPFDLLGLFVRAMALNGMLLITRARFQEAGGFDPALRRNEDMDLWLRLLEWGDPVFNPAVLALRRRHDGNVTCKHPDTSEIIKQKLQQRLTANAPEQIRESGRERLRACVRLLEAEKLQDWDAVLRESEILRAFQVRGFALAVKTVLALRALNRKAEALAEANAWLVNEGNLQGMPIVYIDWMRRAASALMN